MNDSNYSQASTCLTGQTLPGGWKVTKPVKRPETATGGCFSICYWVEKDDGTEAFLKAIDLTAVFHADNKMEELQKISSAFNFESHLYQHCSDASKIIDMFDSGEHEVAGFPPISNLVFFMIFEKASGDARCFREDNPNIPQTDYWRFTSLHHTALGLEQLHQRDYTHLDLKPSNILVDESGGSKIGDLGCAGSHIDTSPRGDFRIPGDPGYSPPECNYRSFNNNSFQVKQSIDCYLLGSLFFFHFCGISARSALYKVVIDKGYEMTGDFEYDIEWLSLAFGDNLAMLESYFESYSPSVRESIISVVSELCEPNPKKRGNCRKLQKYVSQYSMRRYVSKIDAIRRSLY